MEKPTQTSHGKKSMEAYVVMLHLVSQKTVQFTDIRDLLFWDVRKQLTRVSLRR